jgi:hypothetical protein
MGFSSHQEKNPFDIVQNDLDAMENGVRKKGVGNFGWFSWSYPRPRK